MKYVYLIQSLENSCYKIGISKNPYKRVKQLQTGNSSKLKLIECYPSHHANIIEKTLQRRYNNLRKQGEWFDLSLLNEISFKDECRKLEESYDLLKKNGNVFI
ncbi:MAG: GIY-YIG nuclease family protein [bacterium]